MFALWMVSGIRYAMVCGAVRMEEKMERLRDELKTKNRELEYRNEQLRTISGTDALTGACNRQALLNDFDSFLGREICIMMSDIDNFKHYNDSYGHEAGDEVLAGYAALLKKCFVQTQVYRFGGDEFLLVSELKPAEFEETVKYFMKQLETFTTASVREPLTTSAGIVVGKSEDTAILREMFARADHELYRAKHQGKNCYVMEGDFRAAGRTADRKRLDQRRE
jgi:diguanylate cyclase (GGDEF)-like protein